MSIYPHKLKGVPTGRYVVEVERLGQRRKVYVDSLKEAKARDRELRNGVGWAPIVEPDAYSVQDLLADIRHLWEGGKDPLGLRRLEISCEVLGEVLRDAKATLRQVSLEHIDKVIRKLIERHRTNARPMTMKTVPRYLAPLSAALQWADERGKIDKRPSFKKLWPSPGRRPHFTLTADQEAAQKEALEAQRGPDMVTLMDTQLASATRISELLKITPDRIIHHDAEWTILRFEDTKNGGWRETPVRRDLGERFEDLVRKGLPSYASIWRAMRYARKTAGLPTTQPTHAHRHTTLTRLARDGASTIDVMEFAGHSSITTTKGYMDLDLRDKMKTARRLSR
jgi:integrase